MPAHPAHMSNRLQNSSAIARRRPTPRLVARVGRGGAAHRWSASHSHARTRSPSRADPSLRLWSPSSRSVCSHFSAINSCVSKAVPSGTGGAPRCGPESSRRRTARCQPTRGLAPSHPAAPPRARRSRATPSCSPLSQGRVTHAASAALPALHRGSGRRGRPQWDPSRPQAPRRRCLARCNPLYGRLICYASAADAPCRWLGCRSASWVYATSVARISDVHSCTYLSPP